MFKSLLALYPNEGDLKCIGEKNEKWEREIYGRNIRDAHPYTKFSYSSDMLSNLCDEK